MDVQAKQLTFQLDFTHTTMRATASPGEAPTAASPLSLATPPLDGATMNQVGQQMASMGGDADLQQKYYAVVCMLRQLDPRAAQAFVQAMGGSLEMRAQLQGSAGQSDVNASLKATFTSIKAVAQQAPDDLNATLSERVRQNNLNIQAIVTRYNSIHIEGRSQDPLALDLSGDGQLHADSRAQFDLDADGQTEDIPFASQGTAFLALDRNGDGRIDDGGELFGDQHGAANGFDELAKFDDNHDGVIDEQDAVFDRLTLVGDFGTESLRQAGVSQINLGYRNTSQALRPDVTLGQVGSFVRNGRTQLAGDLLLKYA